MIKWFFGLLVLASVSARAAESFFLPLWDSDEKLAAEEIVTPGNGVANVSRPGISVHLPNPAVSTGIAMVVCPGGSYREVGAFADGMGTVPYFVPKGVAVIILKYRTRPPSTDVINEALADAQRAIRLVRYHAKKWGIDPQKIGMVGSSAGSHLILNLASHFDKGHPQAGDKVERLSCRPDFLALICPWPNHQTVDEFPITADTPPALIISAKDDEVAPIAFSQGLVDKMNSAGVSVEFWQVDSGGHSFFEQIANPAYLWKDRLAEWLRKEGFWTT